MKWNNWIHGQKCPKCRRPSYDEMNKSFLENKYILLSEKKDVDLVKSISNYYLKYKCDKGHINSMKWNNWNNGQRCPTCWYESKSSKGEKEVLEYIQSITDTTIIHNDRSQIINPKTGCNLELDIFLPDLMKAIEYNGTYWHSNDKAIYKDNQKVVQCGKLGIDFMVIEEEDWTNNRNKYMIFIKEFLNNDKKE